MKQLFVLTKDSDREKVCVRDTERERERESVCVRRKPFLIHFQRRSFQLKIYKDRI